MERIMKEIRRRTRVVYPSPDGQSALMLVAARLRDIAGTKWGVQQYMNMNRLKEMKSAVVAGYLKRRNDGYQDECAKDI